MIKLRILGGGHSNNKQEMGSNEEYKRQPKRMKIFKLKEENDQYY